jgi:hypothetical protein
MYDTGDRLRLVNIEGGAVFAGLIVGDDGPSHKPSDDEDDSETAQTSFLLVLSGC